jgi:hypothetical protein
MKLRALFAAALLAAAAACAQTPTAPDAHRAPAAPRHDAATDTVTRTTGGMGNGN